MCFSKAKQQIGELYIQFKMKMEMRKHNTFSIANKPIITLIMVLALMRLLQSQRTRRKHVEYFKLTLQLQRLSLTQVILEKDSREINSLEKNGDLINSK